MSRDRRRRPARALRGRGRTYGRGAAATVALAPTDCEVARRRPDRARRPVGLGQVDAAAPHGRARRRRRTGGQLAGDRRARRPAARPRRRGLPGAEPAAAADGASRTSRCRSCSPAPPTRDARAPRARRFERLGPRRARRQAAGGDLRRAGAARRRRPRARRPSRRLILADEPTGQLDRAQRAASSSTSCSWPRATAAPRSSSRPTTRPSPSACPTRWQMHSAGARRHARRGVRMVTLTWLRGLLAHRRARLVSTALGVAVGVALLASIGTFLSATTSKMTARASASVAVDWQVAGQPRARTPPSSSRAVAALRRRHRALAGRHRRHQRAARPRRRAARSRPARPRSRPARRLRDDVPRRAAHARGLRAPACCSPSRPPPTCTPGPGDTIAIGRAGLPAPRSGSTASSRCRRPTRSSSRSARRAGAQPQAPPDNVILLPQRRSGRSRRARRGRPELVARRSTRRSRARCPGARTRRTPQVSGHARNLETALAGGGPRRRQPRHGARPGAPGRALRAAAVPLPRRARRDPRRAGDRARSRRRAPAAAAATPRCCAPAARRRAGSCAIALGETALAGGAGVALGLGGRARRSDRRRSAPRASALRARRGAVGRRRRARRAR